MSSTSTITFDTLFFEEEVTVDVTYKVTSKGYKGKAPDMNQPGEPPEGPEWDIEDITMTIKGVTYSDLPGWLRSFIVNTQEVVEAIDTEIMEG